MEGSVLVVTTGGTIGAQPYPDPRQPPAAATMPSDGADPVAHALAHAFAGEPIRHAALEPRDSNRIDRAYRARLAELIGRSAERGVVVTHGTDTIVRTADFLVRDARARPGRYRDRVVILTGSMTPLANGEGSDGYRNLLAALALARRAGDADLPAIGIVLHAGDPGAWRPVLHPVARPGQYRKVRGDDGRYYRLTATPAPPASRTATRKR